jgi:hypothetical protein
MLPIIRILRIFLIFLAAQPSAFAQAGRIYTKPESSVPGAISGRVAAELTHAIAVAHDHTRVFLGELSDSGHAFQFSHLPAAKYDLVLVAKEGVVYDGLDLGPAPQANSLPKNSLQNLEKRIAASDSFFNRYQIHRTGLSEDGETLLAFVERYRAEGVLKQSGEALGQMVRRLEIAELTQATDDWQLSNSRHLYREGEPRSAARFLRSVYVAALSNIRVVESPKDLGEIALP